MGKIRVLIVDDEVVFRHLVTHALADDPEVEVVATAGDGSIALRRLQEYAVDVVTLDVDMPVMDGLETLQAIRASHPDLPVLMMSAFEKPGARELQAMELGADDCIAKAMRVGRTVNAIGWMRHELVPRIKKVRAARGATAVSTVPTARPLRASARARVRESIRTYPSRSERIDVLAIGASTGGPQALAQLLGGLPDGFPVPIVMVQHMPPDFTRLLAERLSNTTRLLVRESAGGESLASGEAWIAPGDRHMVVERTNGAVVLRTNCLPPENSCRPAVDPLFRSVAEAYGPHVLGVVLTGMGQDGLLGGEAIRRAGGQLLVQDEASSVVWGMPGAVAQAGLADKILPLPAIADEIMLRVSALRASSHRQRNAG